MSNEYTVIDDDFKNVPNHIKKDKNWIGNVDFMKKKVILKPNEKEIKEVLKVKKPNSKSNNTSKAKSKRKR